MSKYEVGFNVEAALRRVVSHAQLRMKEEERRKREDAEKHTYDTAETYYCLVQRANPNAPESERPIYEATTMQEVPGIGTQITGRAASIEGALVEVRFELARAWQRHRIEADWESAKKRASKVKLERELFV